MSAGWCFERKAIFFWSKFPVQEAFMYSNMLRNISMRNSYLIKNSWVNENTVKFILNTKTFITWDLIDNTYIKTFLFNCYYFIDDD